MARDNDTCATASIEATHLVVSSSPPVAINESGHVRTLICAEVSIRQVTP